MARTIRRPTRSLTLPLSHTYPNGSLTKPTGVSWPTPSAEPPSLSRQPHPTQPWTLHPVFKLCLNVQSTSPPCGLRRAKNLPHGGTLNSAYSVAAWPGQSDNPAVPRSPPGHQQLCSSSANSLRLPFDQLASFTETKPPARMTEPPPGSSCFRPPKPSPNQPSRTSAPMAPFQPNAHR